MIIICVKAIYFKVDIFVKQKYCTKYILQNQLYSIIAIQHKTRVATRMAARIFAVIGRDNLS